ncbi:hypothetical protein [Isoptericola aurantiacus]|uniref:hypothetical protein n=1 Tax=Isoptericola aurantiacus TaxID=3377839 RepID=UPI00383A144D
MDDAASPAPPNLTRGFLKIALVEGVVLIAGVVLLVLDVIPTAVFVGIVLACGIGAGLAFMLLVRRAQAATGSTPPNGSTIDPDAPFTD